MCILNDRVPLTDRLVMEVAEDMIDVRNNMIESGSQSSSGATNQKERLTESSGCIYFYIRHLMRQMELYTLKQSPLLLHKGDAGVAYQSEPLVVRFVSSVCILF